MLTSVVVTSFNYSRYIVKAIESVLDQSNSPIELIVIDDGSTDDSVEVVEAIQRDGANLRLVVQENRGVIKTVNRGIEEATGDFITFLASDDYFTTPHSISSRVDYLRANPHFIATFADGYRFGGDDGGRTPLMRAKHKDVLKSADPIALLLKGHSLITATLLYRREILRKIGGFSEKLRYCEDIDIPLRLFMKGPVGFIDVPTYCYREHPQSSSRKNPNLAKADKVVCYEQYLKSESLRPYHYIIKNQLKRKYLALGRYLGRTNGGDEQDRILFRGAWRFVFRDPRLLWYLARWR